MTNPTPKPCGHGERDDCGVNAPWLTLAHVICWDAGIPPGHILARLEKLQELLRSRGGPSKDQEGAQP